MKSDKKPVTVSAINTDKIHEAALFLERNMDHGVDYSAWSTAIKTSWIETPPNFGFALFNKENQIVGLICALYSCQKIDGKLFNVCNPHSWCVLPEYRDHSISLVLAVINQPNYSFTMFTPNKDGIQIFSYLGFKPLDNNLKYIPNIPSLINSSITLITDEDKLTPLLNEENLKIHNDHKAFSSIKKVVIKTKEKKLFILLQTIKYKRCKSARLVYVDDYDYLIANIKIIKHLFLMKLGLIFTIIEKRFAKESYDSIIGFREKGHQRLYISKELKPHQIQYVYSELSALKL